MLNAQEQVTVLRRVESLLEQAIHSASNLPGGDPLVRKINDAASLAQAWRCDQEAELPEDES